MGKTKKPRIRYGRSSNPMTFLEDGLRLLDNNSYENDLDKSVELIRDQLQSPSTEEKVNGLQALAVLSCNKDKVRSVCKSDIVRIVGPLLCECDQSVRNAAAGAIRNLSICGIDVCEILVDQDILTPLLNLLNEYAEDKNWVPKFDESMGNQLDIRSDIFLQSINLLWNLCESVSVAVETFNQTQLLEGLVRCLHFEVFGLEIAISVAQCILIVSESNPKSWSVLSEYSSSIAQILEVSGGSGHNYLRTLSAGIVCNVPALSAFYNVKVLSTLSEVLRIDHRQKLADMDKFALSKLHHKKMPEIEIMDAEENESEQVAALRRRREELPSERDLFFRDIGYVIDSQRLAAEIVTNLCSTDDEEWVDTDGEDVSESESVADCGEGLSKEDNSSYLSSEATAIIKSSGLIELLWQKAQPLDDITIQFLRSENVLLLEKAKNLRISSLICLQNLSNCLSTLDLGGASAIYNMWIELGQQVLKGPQDVSILEPSTSLMRSALGHLKNHKDLFYLMTSNDLELMLSGFRNCSMAEIRANWLRMIGILGCLLPEELVKVIISFIVDSCLAEEDVWTISEALDGLMDVFSDNDWNQIILDLNLPQIMTTLEKQFKAKMRQQRRELNERYPAVQTVLANFSRFVKYISKEFAKNQLQKCI